METTGAGPSRDILFCILSRMPLKSVVRFSSVCKLWFDVINSPEFRKLHSTQSSEDPALIILSHRLLRENVISITPMSIISHHLRVEENSFTNLASSHSWNVVGACNGLLCFASTDYVLVCNPITREHVTLPRHSRDLALEHPTTSIGFGFDAASERYKVVCVLYSNRFLAYDADHKVSAKVYTVDAAGSWRAASDFPMLPCGKPVFANGFLHWSIHPDIVGFERIISFDVGKEESIMTQHPNFGPYFSIAELRGCLSVVDFKRGRSIEVWMLKDHKNHHWEQEYILPVAAPHVVDKGFPRLISISERSGVLLVWLQDAIFIYERRTMSRKKLLISGFPCWLDWEICSGYRPSLAPLRDNPKELHESMSATYFISDFGICCRPALTSQIMGHKASGKSDGLVLCFVKNGMLAH